MIMEKYFSNMTFFNLKIESIDVLRLEKGFTLWMLPILIHLYYQGKTMVEHNIGITRPLRTISLRHHPLGGTPNHPQYNG